MFTISLILRIPHPPPTSYPPQRGGGGCILAPLGASPPPLPVTLSLSSSQLPEIPRWFDPPAFIESLSSLAPPVLPSLPLRTLRLPHFPLPGERDLGPGRRHILMYCRYIIFYTWNTVKCVLIIMFSQQLH